MLAAFLLVVVSLAGGLFLWRNATDTTPILVAARVIPPGHVIRVVRHKARQLLSEKRQDWGLEPVSHPWGNRARRRLVNR